MDPGRKVPLTIRALIARINRKLAKQEECLKTARGAYLKRQFGAYYVVSWRSNLATATAVNPATLAQSLGVLAPWECVETAQGKSHSIGFSGDAPILSPYACSCNGLPSPCLLCTDSHLHGDETWARPPK